MDGKSQIEIRNYLRNIYPNKDAWFLQSAIYEANGMAVVDKNQNKTRIFGGKQNWLARIKNKITNAKWKEVRLLPISSVGEAPQKGNRKIKFDLANNQIIFKVSRDNHVTPQLPKLRKNYQKILLKLEELCNERKSPISVKITTTDICISYDESALSANYSPKTNRHAGIDLNPNYIGLVIYEEDRLLFSRMYKLGELTKTSGKNSNSPESIYLSDKLEYELSKISKDIVDLCDKHGVDLLTTEALTIKAKEHSKGKAFNRLVNNKWPRARVLASLQKWCNLHGIKYASVNPAYSSYIGNLMHDLPDPLAAASEVARRGYELIIKKSKQFYPANLPGVDYLRNQWKKDADWKELFAYIKNSKLKYRVPVPTNGFEKFMSSKSRVTYFGKAGISVYFCV